MGNINLEDLKSGMTLASEVRARNGRLLVPAGKEITEKHLEIFKAWGVTEANIEGVEKKDVMEAAVQEIDPVLLKKSEEVTASVFQHTNLGHPFIAELFRLCVLRTVHQFSENKNP